ncbi:MAG TPA: ferrous iron transport protein B [Bacillota bacterium]|jgi:ferrous iron transport protein B|nr:ferrous iron transport protein B [Bacillota bacterium]HOP69719.1 ferrous iron transport protein B [Bacillota bacterium]HPT33595.1 ferrous iron transport protein B [Bacillota bacterium]HPZ64119.1 ferrous iron transport protein B [Bacillota bacterium]HQD06261.1 ferrous iron transport protein B [Bacillota bacterium]
MGLTGRSTWVGALKEGLNPPLPPGDYVVALSGNPNTGKSTLFNRLTGLRQHTGNWPGKTVASAAGRYSFKGQNFTLVDLPGTYSLLAHSPEEEVARNFICFARPDVTVVVTDATCLERNLILVLQILEITNKVVVCVNLIDEAERKKIAVDLPALARELGVPVVGTNARAGRGLEELKTAVYRVASGLERPEPLSLCYDGDLEAAVGGLEPLIASPGGRGLSRRWVALRLLEGDPGVINSLQKYLDLGLSGPLRQALLTARARLGENPGERAATAIVKKAEAIGSRAMAPAEGRHDHWDRKIDDLVTSRLWGFPIMLALLGVIFWITIAGANYPSELLAAGFLWLEERLTDIFVAAGWEGWVYGLLIEGVYRTLTWVVSVMLPPMAIFFPLFTLLEDLGYLPRVAFNLDGLFKKARAHGKQALTMCMGFGCNAAGVISCRIIESPRERMIAILTNNFVPCNGRFPILIALSTIFLARGGGIWENLLASAAVMAAVVLGVAATLLVSRILSETVLKGLPSSFALEMPPYRKPQVGRILIRSMLDRTLFVLARAVLVAAPAGLVIWLMANLEVKGLSLVNHAAAFLQPVGELIGLDGYILLAFLLGLPANEIVIPIIIMGYLSSGSIMELESLADLQALFVANGWTWLTAVCTMLFTLNHFPCGTTLLTIRRETGSLKWTLLSFLIPTLAGFAVCFVVAQTVRLLGLAG